MGAWVRHSRFAIISSKHCGASAGEVLLHSHSSSSCSLAGGARERFQMRDLLALRAGAALTAERCAASMPPACCACASSVRVPSGCPRGARFCGPAARDLLDSDCDRVTAARDPVERGLGDDASADGRRLAQTLDGEGDEAPDRVARGLYADDTSRRSEAADLVSTRCLYCCSAEARSSPAGRTYSCRPALKLKDSRTGEARLSSVCSSHTLASLGAWMAAAGMLAGCGEGGVVVDGGRSDSPSLAMSANT
ncbi:hypothetical protein FA09DRAFT_122586 [Tilletiopsis washingtonensis]|uniref:Uncharacterized protein n=1 Tax=Tilletiopsis washingtonensis TaxID=58919 RepID=A0A316ZKT8_9BASI|nr:hypothetical protein FA09DRAFT_122586 [Tilletiopsis washingtonensis]PWO01006.1 hypothetical protein FA09DRAFT_122586 [Tilletiopsis washingtonensis]